jgi:DNA mismatch endonuclease, patch repair protein
MADVFDTAKRSDVMSRIRGTGNKTTELALAMAFRTAGIKGWRRHALVKVKLKPMRDAPVDAKQAVLVIKPDFVFRKERVAVFVDGCFWHQCPLHSKVPNSNTVFWAQKLQGNVERDRAADKALKAVGWRTFRLWEHELKDVHNTPLLRRIANRVAQSRACRQR